MGFLHRHARKPRGQISSRTTEDQSPEQRFCTPEEAAAYLGKTPQEFGALVKQYGIGRYHLTRSTDQIVYAMKDLENAKNSLG